LTIIVFGILIENKQIQARESFLFSSSSMFNFKKKIYKNSAKYSKKRSATKKENCYEKCI